MIYSPLECYSNTIYAENLESLATEEGQVRDQEKQEALLAISFSRKIKNNDLKDRFLPKLHVLPLQRHFAIKIQAKFSVHVFNLPKPNNVITIRYT